LSARKLANTDKETDMETKMSKRAIFLSDIIVTALEGGIGYWSQCSKYDHGYNGEGLDEEGRTPAVAVVHEMEDEGWGRYSKEALTIDNKLVAKAFKAIMSKDEIAHASEGWRKRMTKAYWDVDDGVCDIDSGDADCIVQIGLFGEVRYG
jgi:hypothetical protein